MWWANLRQYIGRVFDTTDRWLLRRHAVIPVILIIFPLVLLYNIHVGAGQYWDWNFPFFSSDMHNYFDRASNSWMDHNLGSPLSYTSDYYFRWIVSLSSLLQPETTQYILYVLLFFAAALGVYLLVYRSAGPLGGLLIGLAAIVNPMTYYKYTAGHLDYFVSYAIFIWLAWYMFHRYKGRLVDWVVIGLLFAFVGVQIQFFAIVALFLVLFFLFQKGSPHPLHLLIFLVIVLGVNSVWLSNFFTGGISFNEVSSGSTSFMSSSITSLSDIFTTSFSKASLTWRTYSAVELLFSFGLLAYSLYYTTRQRQYRRQNLLILCFLLILIFLTSGLFLKVSIPVVSSFYPMFRESGHFAPLVILTALLVFRTPHHRRQTIIFSGLCLGVIAISGFKFIQSPHQINFASIRKQFAEFSPGEKTNGALDRKAGVLTYPFYGQYQFLSMPQKLDNGFAMSNTGHDSFIAYSDFRSVSNMTPPEDFRQSVQYRFSKDYDVDMLSPYGIKYIFDFSHIYESNYEKFVPASTYDNNISLIKNDPAFLQKVLQKNKDKVRQISPHVLEIVSAPKTISDARVAYAQTPQDTTAVTAYYHALNETAPDVISDESAPVNVRFTNIFGNYKSKDFLHSPDKALDRSIDRVSATSTKSLISSSEIKELSYEYSNNKLTLYVATPKGLMLNGQALDVNDREAIYSTNPQKRGQDFVLKINETSFVLSESKTIKKLMLVSSSDSLTLFKKTGSNIVSNGSFEDGLWRKDAIDCNKYDDKGMVDMKLSNDAYDGHRSLMLSTRLHSACTYVPVNLERNATYFISYTAKSKNTPTSSFFIDGDKAGTQRKTNSPIPKNDTWVTNVNVFTATSALQRPNLYLYADSTEEEAVNTVLYDNVQVYRLQMEKSLKLSEYGVKYLETKLPDTKQLSFRYAASTTGPITNNVVNGDFKHGLWGDKVSDCANYDNNPDIAMSLENKNSDPYLRLRAKRHIACTYKATPITPNTSYLIRFRYRVMSGAPGYYVAYNTPKPGMYDVEGKIPSNSGKKWTTQSDILKTPADATSATIYLYAYELDGTKESIVDYDDIEIIAIPAIYNSYLLKTEQINPEIISPKRVAYRRISSTEQRVDITGAAKPFYLNFRESYSPGWQLVSASKPNNPLESRHYKLNSFSNGWLVDPQKICTSKGVECNKQGDSYNLSLIVTFIPQKYFEVCRYASVGILLVSGITIGINTLIRRKKKLIQ